eukprot:IDg938t1
MGDAKSRTKQGISRSSCSVVWPSDGKRDRASGWTCKLPLRYSTSKSYSASLRRQRMRRPDVGAEGSNPIDDCEAFAFRRAVVFLCLCENSRPKTDWSLERIRVYVEQSASYLVGAWRPCVIRIPGSVAE